MPEVEIQRIDGKRLSTKDKGDWGERLDGCARDIIKPLAGGIGGMHCARNLTVEGVCYRGWHVYLSLQINLWQIPENRKRQTRVVPESMISGRGLS